MDMGAYSPRISPYVKSEEQEREIAQLHDLERRANEIRLLLRIFLNPLLPEVSKQTEQLDRPWPPPPRSPLV